MPYMFTKTIIVEGVSHGFAESNLRAKQQIIKDEIDNGNFEVIFEEGSIQYVKKVKGGLPYEANTFVFVFLAGSDVPAVFASSVNTLHPDIEIAFGGKRRNTLL